LRKKKPELQYLQRFSRPDLPVGKEEKCVVDEDEKLTSRPSSGVCSREKTEKRACWERSGVGGAASSKGRTQIAQNQGGEEDTVRCGRGLCRRIHIDEGRLTIGKKRWL